jgi:hypothetical protein
LYGYVTVLDIRTSLNHHCMQTAVGTLKRGCF